MGIPLEFWEFSLIFSNLDCHRGKKIAWDGGNLSGVFCFREMKGWAVFPNLIFSRLQLDLRVAFGEFFKLERLGMGRGKISCFS